MGLRVVGFILLPHFRIARTTCNPVLFGKGLFLTSIHSFISKDYPNGKLKDHSDCADAHADLGPRCPHIPEAHFPFGVTYQEGVQCLLKCFHFLRMSFTMNMSCHVLKRASHYYRSDGNPVGSIMVR